MVVAPPGPPEEPPAKKTKAKDEWPFTLLGFAGNDYYYQPGDSGQVLSIAGGQAHSPANLIRLADLGWWEDQFPRYNAEGERMSGANWQDAWNKICRMQHKVGVYDPRRIRGLGAWWDDGRVVYHLGDRLIIGTNEGREQEFSTVPVLEAPAGQYLYQRLPRKSGPGNVPMMSADEGLGLAMLAERFRWDASASARLLMGWIALAPIAGALEWRPHAWISGVSGSGKTTVVNMVVLPLLGDMALFALGNTTEAGLRQTLKSDSLPVVFDEAESNQRQDAARMQNVLALARVASAETGAHQYKGSARGEAMMFEIRSMFMMSSINSALKEGADRSRFSGLKLRSATGSEPVTAGSRVPEWPALPGVHALCTSREGGVSQAPWGSLNLGEHVGDDPAHVRRNRELFNAALQARTPGACTAFLQQADGALRADL
jgi:putative DNA primase/helicase